jgi:hypothetical protein
MTKEFLEDYIVRVAVAIDEITQEEYEMVAEQIFEMIISIARSFVGDWNVPFDIAQDLKYSAAKIGQGN